VQTFIAVVNLPGLVPALRSAGYQLASEDTQPRAVNASLRSAPTDAKVVVIAAHPNGDAKMRDWIAVQSESRRPVLLLAADPDAQPLPKTRVVHLPATFDDIMASFNAPARGDDVGSSVLEPDGTLTSPGSEPITDDGDIWGDDFGFSADPSPDADDDADPPAPDDDDLDSSDDPPVPGDDDDEEEDLDDLDPSVPDDDDLDPSDDPQVPDDDLDYLDDLDPPVPDDDDDDPGYRPPPVPSFGMDDTPPPAPAEAVAPERPGGLIDPDETEEILGVFDRRPDTMLVRSATLGGQSDIIVCWAAKGGVGKTSFAIALAERAAVIGGFKRIVLVDANRGQDGVRKVLRLTGAVDRLPSMYSAAITGDPEQAISTPAQIVQLRHQNLPPVHFATALAPRAGQADPEVVSDQVYGAVIDWARRNADLVIVDTQIKESHDTSGLFDRLLEPILTAAAGSFSVAMADTSVEGVLNLIERLKAFGAGDIPPERTLAVINRVEANSPLDIPATVRYLEGKMHFVGSVMQSPDVLNAFSTGRIPHDDPALARVLDDILFKVTGASQFDSDRHCDRYADPSSLAKGRSRWSRFGRRG